MPAATAARTPQELETLFEDTLVVGDTWALAGLFEASALLVGAEGQSIRGNAAIAREALATWHGERSYVADPRWVNQARDIALIVAERSINVVRRDRDGGWRYAIILLAGDAADGKVDQ